MKSRIGIYIIIFIGIIISIQLACKKKVTEEIPSLVTINVTDITSSSITSGGLVFSSGGDSVVSRGICLSTELSPEITDIKTINGSGTGSYTSLVAGLMPGTNYYIRAYATNSIGTGYGNQFAVTTKGYLITLTTTAISSITAISALSGGTIAGDISTVIDSRGVCWSISPGPTISDSKTIDGSGPGTFSSSLTGLTVGTTYFVRAYAISGTGIIYGNELTFKAICDLPASPTLITGNKVIDPNAAGLVYSITAVQGATNYNWKIPSGATIVSGQGTTSITVNFGTTGGDISVSAGNSCGNSAYSTLAVSTCPVPAAPGSITGNPNIAPNATGIVFSIIPVNGATKYNWRVPAGATIILGQGTTAITVDFGNTGGNVSVQTESNCGSSSYTDLLITICSIPQAPGTITGATTINQFATGIGYSIPAVTGATNYTWTVPSGATIVSGQGTLGILVNFGSTGGTISVRSENSCGKSLFTNIEIAMCYLPAAPEVVNGPSEVIPNVLGITYTTPAVQWATDYTWMVPPGATIVSNQGTTTVTVNFGTTGGNVSVRAENNCGISPYTSMIVTVRAILPTIVTSEVIPITSATASGGGNITSDGGSAIIARGVCWNTSPTPTTANSTTSDGPGSGLFSSYLTGLTTGIKYYVRAYATNSAGTSYGNEVIYTAIGNLPILGVTSIICFTAATASVSGDISSDGGSAVIARGVCWSAATGPTIADNKSSDGTGISAFTSELTGLAGGTTYYVRPYATNSTGTSYGDELSFTTLPATFPNCGTISDIDGNVYKTVTIGSQCWMAENLKTTTYRNGDPIPNVTDNTTWWTLTTGAYCWYNNDEATFKPDYGALYNWYTVSDSRNACPTGWHVPNETEWETLTTYLGGLSVAAGPLKETCFTHWGIPNTGATNSTGFTALPGGYRDITWAFSSIGDGGHYWSSTEINSNGAWDRYLRSSTSDVDIHPVGFNKMLGFSVRCIQGEPPASLPALVSIDIPCDVVTSTTATGGGNITSDGGSAITERGVCWSTASGPTIANSKTSDGPGSGTFASTITGLNEGVTYYVRAYATNNAGTAYGNEVIIATIQTTFPNCGNVTDIDGNIYKTVTIGTQCWMAENLKTTTYRNGDVIPNVTDLVGIGTGSYAWYNNDAATYKTAYGALYNWPSIADSRNLCPAGWHLPTDSEWTTLTTFLGGESVAGGKLKEACFTHWVNPNTEATNSSGFTALPGGNYGYAGAYYAIGNVGGWWSTTESSATYAFRRSMFYNNSYLSRDTAVKYDGFSVRCVQGESPIPTVPLLITPTATDIATTTASSGGNITSDGGAAITAKGVCWSTLAGPTIADNITSDGTGSGAFQSTLTGLTAGTTYYVRAYATNSAGTSYGNEVTFTTSCILPETPGIISGRASVSINETGIVYSISPVADATSYNWTVPSGATIVSGQGTTTISVNFGNSGGDVGVRTENSCGNSPYTNKTICVLDSFTDSRDGKTYKMAQIGTQVWMAENLAYLPEVNPPSDGSFTLPYYYVYDYYGTDLVAAGATGNFRTYGVLYNWPAAMAGFATSSSNPSGVRGICPAGWHLPSDDEWTTLTSYLGGDGAAGSKLKETGTVHWFAPNVGATNETCFSALPGGYRFDSGLFWNYGEYGWWWSSTEGTAQDAAMRNLLSGTGTVGKGNYSKSNGLAVRCVSGESVVIPTAPVLITTSATMITETSLSSGGTITSDGGAPITLKGVCWSTAPGPTTADIVTLDGTGSGVFTSIISPLTPGTTYYVRAYATNSAGTSYGNEITFTTVAANLPSITTLDIICSSITSSTASTGGNIIFGGGFTVTSSGVCWSTSPGPTTTDNKTTDGAALGIFASTIDGLSPGTTFFVRAYATNGAGTSYGNEVTFTSAQSSYPGCGPVSDIDGNVYNTVIIGTQCWMKENLKTTRYSNSDPIANVIDGTEWWSLSTGAYCWYNNDAVTYKDSYGALYNWYAAADSRNVCPVGWHSATDADWTTLTTVLGGDGSAGGPMKETCLTHWIGPNAGATNTSGFTALPGGYRPGTGAFNSLGYLGYWWSSTEDSGWGGWYRAINYNSINVIRIFDRKEFGFSVRCVKDN